jgi:hypothetical protein
LCGLVNKTNDFGYCGECKHDVCKSVREFWDFSDFRRPLPKNVRGGKTVPSHIASRTAWFRNELMKNFGVGQIYKLPLEKRFDVAIAFQLLRMTKEKNECIEECTFAANRSIEDGQRRQQEDRKSYSAASYSVGKYGNAKDCERT